MKKLLLFLFSAFAFAACEQAPIKEMQGAAINERNLEVSFEGGDDTRIQLQNGKTVWTKGDHVSVFYRSTVNEDWQFMGETGDRTGNIVPVDNTLNPPATHNRVVVIYPYNNEYYLNTETYSIEASLPAVQNYLKDSYGTNGNIMVSSNDYKQVSLKSVCGWLKLQLTGDGEVVKSITLRGNNGEQVAGELHINTSDATCVLASASGDAGESEVGGTLVRPGTILTEVTLDCGEGVALGKNATAFYIALPPQTFENGFTVEVENTEGYVMEQSTDKALTIERNHIQPMAAFEFINPNRPTQPTPASNEIWYTSSDGNFVTPYKTNAFGANITSNTYSNGKGVITFDDSVTTIGYAAFEYCTSLTSVTIPDSVTTIGEWAFYNCSSLTSVNIPDSVTTIGNYAFFSCGSLTSVNIPDSVTTIGEEAFIWCDSLKEFKGKFATEDGRSLIVDNTIIAYANASGNTYNIPDSVTSIGYMAFYCCISLTSVNIPDSATTIGESAFEGCYSLTSVNIGNSVTTIGSSAFYDCSSLTSVNIPDSVTEIGEDAFYSCDSLISVNIPDSVTTIGAWVFGQCDSLTSVNIGDSVKTIGHDAFYDCDSLTSVTIPDSVTTIGNSAFWNCTSLTSVNIPDSVTTIGDVAFKYCGRMTSVTIGDSVKTIGYDAFVGCTSLTSVYCKATTPPASGAWVFDDNGSGRKIYVPTESVEAYKSAYGWKNYASAIVGYNF